ncbi:MAG: helix-hairpin-helix domain-containing protein [Anaerolineae bacterium]|nr:MAG: helix-hairpin-helix domain-containing protein [Anaerolineae bacterium]
MAQRIIDGRPYAQIEDIKRVRGIGDATFQKLQALITTQ